MPPAAWIRVKIAVKSTQNYFCRNFVQLV
jgi:hypothetical protein